MEGYCSTDQSPQWAVVPIEEEEEEEEEEENPASYNMAIIIEQDATEYSLFKFVNCLTCFGWYFTHHQELITLYLLYLALMGPLLLPVVKGPELQFPSIHDRYQYRLH